jgi:hypothetical protein
MSSGLIATPLVFPRWFYGIYLALKHYDPIYQGMDDQDPCSPEGQDSTLVVVALTLEPKDRVAWPRDHKRQNHEPKDLRA